LGVGVAGGTVALGTVGLNAYYDRPPGTNVLTNTGYAAGATLLTSAVVVGAGLAIQGGLLTQAATATGNAIAGVCATHPVVCANAGIVVDVADKLEEAALTLQLTIETATGNPHAGETAIELQLEQMDGGAPGNTVAAELGEQLAKLGPDALDSATEYGEDAIPFLLKHGDVAVNMLKKQELSPETMAKLANLPNNATDLADDIVNKVGTDIKENPLRVEYENKVTGLSEKLNDMLQRNNGVVTESDAKTLFEARRSLGVEYKNLTPDPLRDYIYTVNVERYGDPLGLTWEAALKKYDSDYKRLAEAAIRPNPDVNKLLSGFNEWLIQQDVEYLLIAELALTGGQP